MGRDGGWAVDLAAEAKAGCPPRVGQRVQPLCCQLALEAAEQVEAASEDGAG